MSRRTFLAAGAGAATLAACGGAGSQTASSSPTRASEDVPFVMGAITPGETLVAGKPQRVLLGLRNNDGSYTEKVPDAIDVTLADVDHNPLAAPVRAFAHRDGIPQPYYRADVAFPSAGSFYLVTRIDGQDIAAGISVTSDSLVPKVDDAMIPFDTPTAASHAGFEFVCSRTPPCPLHDLTLTQALAEQRPLAFLISTPMFCQVAICGPVLELLLAAQQQFPQVRFLHSDVYASAADAQPSVGKVVPVVQAYALTYEPVLFLATPGGVVEDRVDTLFDAVELKDALSRLVA